MTARARIASIVGLVLVAAATFLPIGRVGHAFSGLGQLWGREAAWWALAAAIVFCVLVVGRESLSSIGFRRPGLWDIVLGVLAGLVIFVGMGLIYAFVFPALHLKPNTGVIGGLYATPVLYRILMVTRAAVVEEIVWRGYTIERIEGLTGSRFLAAAVSLAAFTYAHLESWGAAHLIGVGFAAVILTGLYLWRRNIWTVMIAHWLTDGAAFLLLPLLAPMHG